jgi:hypothetical protein
MCQQYLLTPCAYKRASPRLLKRASQALTQFDFRLPLQQVAGERDVGLALLRVIDGQRLVDQLRGRACELFDDLRQFEQGELVRVAYVHRVVVAGLGQRDDPADQIVHVGERARLAAVAEDRDRATAQCLAQERRNRPPVMRAHTTAVGVEDPHDRRVDTLLAVIGHRQGLRIALGLVVDAAGADRVDVTPVVLRLRMHERIAVDLAGRCRQETRPLDLGEAERVVSSIGAHLERVQRQPQVVDRRGRRGEVVDEVDRLLDEVLVGDVEIQIGEALDVADVRDVAQRPGLEVVHADHAVASREQLVAEMRTEKSGAAGYKAGGHDPEGYRVASAEAR